jgi:hypothetical protein
MNEIDNGLARARDFLGSIPGAAEKAVANALNRAAKSARESAISAIEARYAVRPSDVREKIAISTATPSRHEIVVTARSGSLALGYFPHVPDAVGTGGRNRPVLRAEVLRGAPKTVAGAFVAPINGKPRIMIRTGGTTKTGRTQIKSLSTVPIANMLGAETVQQAVESRAFAVFDEHLGREIDRALKRAT